MFVSLISTPLVPGYWLSDKYSTNTGLVICGEVEGLIVEPLSAVGIAVLESTFFSPPEPDLETLKGTALRNLRGAYRPLDRTFIPVYSRG